MKISHIFLFLSLTLSSKLFANNKALFDSVKCMRTAKAIVSLINDPRDLMKPLPRELQEVTSLACEYYQSSNKQQPAQLRKILAWLRAKRIMPAEEQAMRSLRGLKRTQKNASS